MRLTNLNLTVEFDENEVAWPQGRGGLERYAEEILSKAFGATVADQLEVTQVTPTQFRGYFSVTIAAYEPEATS